MSVRSFLDRGLARILARLADVFFRRPSETTLSPEPYGPTEIPWDEMLKRSTACVPRPQSGMPRSGRPRSSLRWSPEVRSRMVDRLVDRIDSLEAANEGKPHDPLS